LQGQRSITNCSCVAGYEGPDGGYDCRPCSQGKYKNVPGSACFACPAGTYSGETGSLDDAACLPCPLHMDSPAGSNQISACICQRGYTGLDECRTCDAGTYKPVLGSSPCLLCDVGKYGDVPAAQDESACYLCKAGKYSESMGGTFDSCIDCPAAKYSSIPGASTLLYCVPCNSGTYSSSGGGNSTSICLVCPRGKFSDADGKRRERWVGRVFDKPDIL